MKYSTVTNEQLAVLQQGLDLLGHVSRDLLPTTLYLYGLLKPDSHILASVVEAAWEDSYAGETAEDELKITTAAVSIRLSGDVLGALLGSGLTSDDDEFVYMLNGEIHSSQFGYTEMKPKLLISQFSKVALADDSYWLKDFLQAEGASQEQAHPSVVTRTEHAVGDHGGTEAPLHQDTHQSSLKIWADMHVASWEDSDTLDVIHRMEKAKVASATDKFVVWHNEDRLLLIQASDKNEALNLIARSAKVSIQSASTAEIFEGKHIVGALKGYLVD